LASLEPSAGAKVRVTRSSPLSVSESPDVFVIAPDMKSTWWHARPLPGDDALFYRVSLALDAHQIPALCYHDNVTGYVSYAYRRGPDWKVERVENGGAAPRMAFDAADVPHLISTVSGALHHAWKTGPTTWSIETVDAGVAAGGTPDI